MFIKEKKIAIISNDPVLAKNIQLSLRHLFSPIVFCSITDLEQSNFEPASLNAIIADIELSEISRLNKILISKASNFAPLIILLNAINNTDRKIAIDIGVTEVLLKPLDKNGLRLRLTYLIENATKKKGANINTPSYKFILTKRVFDIIFSSIAMVLLSPLFLLIAFLIRIESKGPIFYYSLRVGTGYKVFKFFKFRSMLIGADKELKNLTHLNQYNKPKEINSNNLADKNTLCMACISAGTGCKKLLYADDDIICEHLFNTQKQNNLVPAFIKIKDDPRITRIGNFIRNTSIDELPQLWNVFIGDMSIVGNRPLPLYEAEKITTDVYALRFMAPAGITGLWQIEKRGKTNMLEAERMELDNSYAISQSFMNDMKLIFRTIPALFQSQNV